MRPVHDIDAILLLSLSVAAKRRPAGLVGIIAAADLAQGVIPAAVELPKAFARLSACGLVIGVDGGYSLSAAAQEMMKGQRKSDDTEMKMSRLREHLAGYHPRGEHTAILLSLDQLLAAVQAYRKEKSTGRSWLKPRPKQVWIPARELKGKPHPVRSRKS